MSFGRILCMIPAIAAAGATSWLLLVQARPELPLWAAVGCSILSLLVWLAVLTWRVSVVWLFVAVAAVLGFAGVPAGYPLAVLGVIGVGKLIVAAWGNRGLLTGSRIRSVRSVAAPRGLVEYCGDED